MLQQIVFRSILGTQQSIMQSYQDSSSPRTFLFFIIETFVNAIIPEVLKSICGDFTHCDRDCFLNLKPSYIAIPSSYGFGKNVSAQLLCKVWIASRNLKYEP